MRVVTSPLGQYPSSSLCVCITQCWQVNFLCESKESYDKMGKMGVVFTIPLQFPSMGYI